MDDGRWFDARRATPYPEERVQIVCKDGYTDMAVFGADGNYYVRDWDTWSSRAAHGVKKWRYILYGKKSHKPHGSV